MNRTFGTVWYTEQKKFYSKLEFLTAKIALKTVGPTHSTMYWVHCAYFILFCVY